MAKVLMSINPTHAEKILSGTKKYEFRKTRCKLPIDTIVIYATAPIMKVLGEVKVKSVIDLQLASCFSEFILFCSR